MATRAKSVEETPSENDISLLNLENESEESTMPNEVEVKKLKRSAYASFLNVGTKTTPSFSIT